MNIFQKWIVLTLWTITLFWMPLGYVAFGTTYYVDTSCTDTNPNSATVDGTGYNPAGPTFCSGGSDSYYVTIGDLNAKDFANGDVISFRKGQSWEQTNTSFTLGGITSQNSKHIYLEPHGTGNRPWLKGGGAGSGYPPVDMDRDGMDITITGLDFSGQMYVAADKKVNVRLRDFDDVTVTDCYWDGSIGYTGTPTDWATAFEVEDASGVVTLSDLTITKFGPEANWTGGSPGPAGGSDYMGLVVEDCDAGSYSIKNVEISYIEADCIQVYISTATGTMGGSETDSNKLWNCGEDGIDFKSSSNGTIEYNWIYRDGYTGDHSDKGALISILADNTSNTGTNSVISRYNKLGATDTYHVTITGDNHNDFCTGSGSPWSCCTGSGTGTCAAQVDGVEHYGNEQLGAAARHYNLKNFIRAVEIHHNVHGNFTDNHIYASIRDKSTAAADQVKYYHNSLNHTSGNVSDVIEVDRDFDASLEIGANIFAVDDSDALFVRWNDLAGDGPEFSERNVWYNPSNAGTLFNWDGTTYNTVAAWAAAEGHADSEEVEPKFNGASDLTLASDSTLIDYDDFSGLTLTTWDDQAMNPNNVWALDAFDVTAENQASHGSNYEPGAYFYDIAVGAQAIIVITF